MITYWGNPNHPEHLAHLMFLLRAAVATGAVMAAEMSLT